MNPFSFDLIRSPNGKDFVGALSAMTFEFSCDDSSNCKFAIFFEWRWERQRGRFLGVLVEPESELESNGTFTDLPRSTMSNHWCRKWQNESRTLKNNETATFSSLAKISGTVN